MCNGLTFSAPECSRRYGCISSKILTVPKKEMMKIKVIESLLVLFFLFPILCEVRVSTDETIVLSPQEVSAFRAKIVSSESLLVEIVVYSFSTIREVYSLDESGSLVMKNEAGFIRCMITISGETRRKEVIFVDASGENKETLFREAAAKINSILSQDPAAN